MMSVQCKKCGATNLFDETKNVPTYCSFCAAHLPDMTQFVKDSLKLNIDKQRNTLEINRLDKEIKKEKVSNISNILDFIETVVVIGGMFAALLFIYGLIHR